jgi:hypothetical protein
MSILIVKQKPWELGYEGTGSWRCSWTRASWKHDLGSLRLWAAAAGWHLGESLRAEPEFLERGDRGELSKPGAVQVSLGQLGDNPRLVLSRWEPYWELRKVSFSEAGPSGAQLPGGIFIQIPMSPQESLFDIVYATY